MAIVQDWKIRPTQARCELSGESFADGDEFHTCIFEDAETDGFLRRDYSTESWAKVRGSLDPAPFSTWKSTYKVPEAKSAEEEGNAEHSVEGMLRRFIDEDDPATENLRYILALMLERGKTLVPVDTKETGTRTLIFYEHADSGDVFIVADPGLRLDEVAEVQRQVAEQLAEEERRLAGEGSAGSGDEVEPQQEKAEENEEKADQHGQASAETEDETVGAAGEEAPQEVGAQLGVDSGQELADKPDHHLRRAEGGEQPAAPDHELESGGRF